METTIVRVPDIHKVIIVESIPILRIYKTSLPKENNKLTILDEFNSKKIKGMPVICPYES